MDIELLSKKPFTELLPAERRLLMKVSRQLRIVKRNEEKLEKSQERIAKLNAEIQETVDGQKTLQETIRDAKLVITAIERATSIEEAIGKDDAADAAKSEGATA